LIESELARIVDIQLGRLEHRLAQQNLTLDVDVAAKSLLAKEGYNRNSARARSSARFRNTCSTRSQRSCSKVVSNLEKRSRCQPTTESSCS